MEHKFIFCIFNKTSIKFAKFLNSFYDKIRQILLWFQNFQWFSSYLVWKFAFSNFDGLNSRIESLKDLNFRECVKHVVQLCLLMNPSQIVFSYLSHRFCNESLKMAIFVFSKQICSAKKLLYLFKNDFLLRNLIRGTNFITTVFG